MQVKNEACHGRWKLWLTEIPSHDSSADELSLLSSGEALWTVECRYNRVYQTQAYWRIDDSGQLLLSSQTGRVFSRCDLELSGDLMTLRPAHGHCSLYERVTEAG